MTQTILTTLVVVEGLMIGCLWYYKKVQSSTVRLLLECLDRRDEESGPEHAALVKLVTPFML